MWHMSLKIVFLSLTANIDYIIYLFLDRFIANGSFKLLAFFFNADRKVFITKVLLFHLITFDFNGACLLNTLRN